MRGKTHVLEVWGDLACYSKPESKVERYSYQVITPSAARGIFDAIYWKPEDNFYWQIERVELLSEPRYLALRRNEVKDKAPSHSVILKWKEGKESISPIFADGVGVDQKGRTQRQTMALKQVHYRLHAHMCFRHEKGNVASRDAQFVRRAKQGKCIYQPYLGCREFPAFFNLITNIKEAIEKAPPLKMKIDLGWMLYDVFDLSQQNDNNAMAKISFFKAVVEKGVLEVPAYTTEAVRKAEENNYVG